MKISIQLVFLLYILNSCSKNTTPHKEHITHGNKEVFYYGSVHSNDSLNPMFKDIENSFKEFKPEVVLIEGGYDNSRYSTRNEAIKNGEMAFVSFLANQNNIKRQNIEPSGIYVDSILMQKYSKDQILTMYALRQTFQFINQIKNNDNLFKKDIVDYINQVNNHHLEKQSDFINFEEIFCIVKKETGIVITEENWRDQEVTIRRYLYKRGSTISKIHKSVVEIRDAYAINKIINILGCHNKVFVIMGNQHLFNQVSILKKKIEKKFE